MKKDHLLSLQDLKSKFDIKTNFLIYWSLQKSILASMTNQGISKKKMNNKPFIPFHT
jgi:hypothetical protein